MNKEEDKWRTFFPNHFHLINNINPKTFILDVAYTEELPSVYTLRMNFFRRHVQKTIPPRNTIVTGSIPIGPVKTNTTDDEFDSTENEFSTTPTALSPIENTINLSNEIDSSSKTSTSEHLSVKHPGLLRLFDSTVCTVSIIITYLFSSKEPIVQEFLGRKLFDCPTEELDFYLPQLINMYIHIQSISNVIHDYIRTR